MGGNSKHVVECFNHFSLFSLSEASGSWYPIKYHELWPGKPYVVNIHEEAWICIFILYNSDLNTSTVNLASPYLLVQLLLIHKSLFGHCLSMFTVKTDCFKPCFPMSIGLYVLMFNLLTDQFKSVNKGESVVTPRVLFSSQIFYAINRVLCDICIVFFLLTAKYLFVKKRERMHKSQCTWRHKIQRKKCNRYAIRQVSPKTETCHDANFVAIGGRGICRYINRRCSQGRQIWHYTNSQFSSLVNREIWKAIHWAVLE